MGKFKVGDKVRVRQWNDMEKEFGTFPSGSIKTTYAFVDDMKKYCDKVVTIASVISDRYYIKEDCGTWNWSDDMFETKAQSIVIYAKGNKVIAVDKSTGETAEARCNPEDTFDFYIGANLAFNRLTKRESKLKSEFYNGKVICTHSGGYFTEGKIYKVKNGVITRDSGLTDSGIKSVEHLNRLYGSQFAEVKNTKTEPKLYEGEVVCTKNGGNFTVGKVYHIKKGILTNDHGRHFGPYEKFEDFSDYLVSEFIEVVK